MRRPTAIKAKREQQALLDDEINNHHNRNNKEEKENNLAECEHEKKQGLKKPKMRVINPSEKFRFTFEWEDTEDILEEEDIMEEEDILEEEENNLGECEQEKKQGLKKPKMRVINPSEKFRFTFEWEDTEDILEEEDIMEEEDILEEEENNLAECEKKVGSKKPKMRVIKPNEKFRFTFEWEETEDILEDIETEDILYHDSDEAQLLFG